MKRVAIASLVLSFLVVVSTFAFFPRVAHADTYPGYDIEVQMLYCIDKDDPCNTPATIRNSLYIQVDAVSFHPGRTEGRPDGVDFTCGRAYFDKNGVFHDVAEHVFAGSAPPFESGTIKGEAVLEKAYTENSTRAESEIESITAHDNVTGDTATVWGEMVSNNQTDLRVSGGFHVELHGPIYDESFPSPTGPPVVKVVGHGEMECNSFGRFVSAPFASGPFFEGVLGNTDND